MAPIASLATSLELLGPRRDSLAEYEGQLREDIKADVIGAVGAYSDHLAAVIRSNPDRDIRDILTRADLERSLNLSMDQLKTRAAGRIRSSWYHGSDLATEHVNEEIDRLTGGFHLRRDRSDNAYLEDLINDSNRNIDSLTNALVESAERTFEREGFPLSIAEGGTAKNVRKEKAGRVATLLKDSLTLSAQRAGIRVAYGSGVAAQRGFTNQQIAAYARLAAMDPSTRKVWVANFIDNTPCDMCWALHGVSLPIGQSFDPYASFGRVVRTYHDLIGPPRHPHCQCKLVVTRDGMDFSTASPETMQQFSQEKLRDEIGLHAARAALEHVAILFI